MSEIDATILDRLFATIEARKGADPASSWTAKLLAGGPEKIAKKVGEESAETIIAALTQDGGALADESADLLFHWLVALTAKNIDTQRVWAELARPLRLSGHDANRKRSG